MSEKCKLHSKHFIFLCYQPSCFKLLCLNCINDHQRDCHFHNNTYQDLISLEEIPFILKDRVEKIQENIKKTYLHKKDLLINYFFSQLNEITSYYFDNFNKCLANEALDIIEITGEDSLLEIRERIHNFLTKKAKNQDDYINILKETNLNIIIEKIIKKEMSSNITKYPELTKSFNEIQEITDAIEHCFLDFKKIVFSESYSLEINQMLNYVAKPIKNEELTSQDHNLDLLCDMDFKKILSNLEKSNEIKKNIEEANEIIKLHEAFDEYKNENNDNKIQTLKKNYIDKPEKNEKNINFLQNELIQELISETEISKYVNLEKTNYDSKKKENDEKQEEKRENIDLQATKLIKEEIIEAKEELVVNEDGVLIDYDLEEFEYELESLNPDNTYLFLYHLPPFSSEYFLDILDLCCKRIFLKNFAGINSIKEGSLNENKYNFLVTSGKFKSVEQEISLSEAILVNFENEDKKKYDLIFDSQGLKLILPFEESNILKFKSKNDVEEQNVYYSEELISLIKENSQKLEEEFKNRCPLNFHYKKYFVQINESYDKIRIIEKFTGYRMFLRNFEKGLSLKKFNMDLIFDYLESNNIHILHLDELDIFMTISQHLSFIIFNRKYQDLMIANLITPELIINLMDYLFKEFKNVDLSIEVILKTLLFNSDLKFQKSESGFLFSKRLEILKENGEITELTNVVNCEIIICDFSIKINERRKKKCLYVLKAYHQVILAFDETTSIKNCLDSKNIIVQQYDEDLREILRISQYFLKYNLNNFMQSLIQFEEYLIIYVVGDNSSFYIKNLQDNSKKIMLFYQVFEPNQHKYHHLKDEFFKFLNKLPKNVIYRESSYIQFLYKINTKELIVRWNGNNINLFQLENKKNEIKKNSKPSYQKKEKEQRPKEIKRDILLACEESEN